MFEMETIKERAFEINNVPFVIETWRDKEDGKFIYGFVAKALTETSGCFDIIGEADKLVEAQEICQQYADKKTI